MRCRLFKTASPWLLLNIIVWSPEKSSTCKASFQEKGTGRRLLACGRPERWGPRKAGRPAAPSALVPEVLAAHVRPCRAPHICILLRRSESHGGTRGHTCCGRPGPRQWMLFLSSFFFLIKKKNLLAAYHQEKQHCFQGLLSLHSQISCFFGLGGQDQ